MIIFFRKIREYLLSEGKTGKYIKYAFGEIILVVIGILIAVQINNWNTEVQIRKLEEKYLTEIRNNLQLDLPDVHFNIDFNEQRLKSNEFVLSYLNKEIDYSDSLKYHFSNLMFTARTLPNTSAFENLKARGLEIISNDSLRQSITTLYSFTFANLMDFEKQDDHAFQYQVFIPEVSKALKIAAIWGNAEPINDEGIFENHEFKNALITNIFLRETMLSYYYGLREKIEETISQIDQEL